MNKIIRTQIRQRNAVFVRMLDCRVPWPEYSKLFDEYLFLSLGYDKVTPFSQGLFLTPYASVSVSEYFATAFEYYFVQADISRVREISPQLFNKLREISESLD